MIRKFSRCNLTFDLCMIQLPGYLVLRFYFNSLLFFIVLF